MPILQTRARAVIHEHGGLRLAARKLRINHTVLSMLADGKRTGASERTLRALGLTKRVRALKEVPNA